MKTRRAVKPYQKEEKMDDVYYLSWNNLDKKIPPNYDEKAIPEIDKITKYIGARDIVKNKIYNYLIYYYNKGIKKGIMHTLYIYNSKGETKRIYFEIGENIKLELVEEKGGAK